jgi:poly(A) polymerase
MRRAAGKIVSKLRLHGHEAYFAGGWVRDFLLHRKPKDIDIATSALPDEVCRLFPKSRAIGVHFGVIQVLMYGNAYEVATFRRDNAYVDGRHPSTVSFSNSQEDASRRDFTVNGLFFDPITNRVIDYVQGENDLRNKLLRTIGDPYQRFSEDKLRMLRAIRFSCNLNFNIESETWNAIEFLAKDILQVSWERIRDEFIKILSGSDPGTGFDLLNRSGLLRFIVPEMAVLAQAPASELEQCNQIRKSLSLLHKPSTVLVMGVLVHFLESSFADRKLSTEFEKETRSERICRRLKLSHEETRQIVDLASSHGSFVEPEELARSVWMRLLQKPNIEDHLELLRVSLRSRGKSLQRHSHWQQKLAEYRRLPENHPLINGEDITELGHLPGPLYKEILRTIEDLQLEGALKTREDALHYIREHYPAPNPL